MAKKKGKGWHGEKHRHSEAAKKGALKKAKKRAEIFERGKSEKKTNKQKGFKYKDIKVSIFKYKNKSIYRYSFTAKDGDHFTYKIPAKNREIADKALKERMDSLNLDIREMKIYGGKGKEIHGIAKAKKIHSERSKKAQKVDRSKTSKHTFRKATEENIETWFEAPGKSDMKSIDTKIPKK